jgi:hypothetical protein
MKAPMNKKGGITTSTVWAVGGLVIGVIVMLIIIQTITNADLFNDEARQEGISWYNQTSTIMNETGFYVGNYTRTGAKCSGIVATNATSGAIIPATNYTITNCLVQFTGAEGYYNNTIWKFNSTTDYTTKSHEEVSTTDMKTNITEGVGNISAKIPTILLIIAVILLLGALVLLIRNTGIIGNSSTGSL